MRFLFVDAGPGDATVLELPREAIHRLRKVLRVRPGAELEVVDRSRPRRGRARLVDGSRLEVLAWEDLGPPPEPDLWLCPALIKADRLEWAAQRCFELGLRRLAPLTTLRTQVRPGRRMEERLRRVAEAAGEQSGRMHLPELAPPLDLAGRLEEARAGGRRLLLAHLEGEPLPERLDGPVALFVGPEGGFDDEEVGAAVEAGARVVALGGHVLRAETACVALTTLALERAGWLRRGGAPPPGG